MTEHKAVNEWKGAVINKAMSNSTIEEIEELTEIPACRILINVERMKINEKM